MIDIQNDGVICTTELRQAMIEYLDCSIVTADKNTRQIMDKIDFDHSGEIDYSGRIFLMKEFVIASIDLKRLL